MKKYVIICSLVFFQWSFAQKEVLFFQTRWGSELSWDAFCDKTKNSGYDGVETWLPENKEEQKALFNALKKHGLKVILLCGVNRKIPFEESLNAYIASLERAAAYKPVNINSHTGSDFFTQTQNEAFIHAAQKVSRKYDITIYHETHRGRFSYTLPETLYFLHVIPDFWLTLDISHWMVVHESLLQAQDGLLEKILARTGHIHARVGFEQGPQVNDPTAPEWEKVLQRHLAIWKKVIYRRWDEDRVVTVTTEFGPPHYLPSLPFTQMPLADQWKANVFIMEAIKKQLHD